MMKLRSLTYWHTSFPKHIVIGNLKIIDADGLTLTSTDSQDEFQRYRMYIQYQANKDQPEVPTDEEMMSTELAHFLDRTLELSDSENDGGANREQGR